MALSLATAFLASARWREAQALLSAASASGETPMFRAVRVDGTGWAALFFWGMRFRSDTLRELQAEPFFAAARGRGEVGELISTSPGATAPSWILALSSATRPLPYLPPGSYEVELALRLGGTGRYRFETMIYPLASS